MTESESVVHTISRIRKQLGKTSCGASRPAAHPRIVAWQGCRAEVKQAAAGAPNLMCCCYGRSVNDLGRAITRGLAALCAEVQNLVRAGAAVFGAQRACLYRVARISPQIQEGSGYRV